MGIDTAKYKKRLLAEQQELQHLSDVEVETRAPVELDQTSVGRVSRIDAMQVHEMALETERRRQIQLERIAAALQRIAEGDYGYCLACDDTISEKRLQLDPAVPLCIKCAEN